MPSPSRIPLFLPGIFPTHPARRLRKTIVEQYFTLATNPDLLPPQSRYAIVSQCSILILACGQQSFIGAVRNCAQGIFQAKSVLAEVCTASICRSVFPGALALLGLTSIRWDCRGKHRTDSTYSRRSQHLDGKKVCRCVRGRASRISRRKTRGHDSVGHDGERNYRYSELV